jgi:excisionase family DNA binding protein
MSSSDQLMTPDPTPTEPEYLTVEEVAGRLKVKEKTVREWIATGMLEAYKIGRIWRIRSDHLDQAMEVRRVSPQTGASGGLWDPDA